jgi:hypothetical protein
MKAPQLGVLDLRERVALAPVDDVGVLLLCRLEEGSQEQRVEVPVGVNEAEVAPPAPKVTRMSFRLHNE